MSSIVQPMAVPVTAATLAAPPAGTDPTQRWEYDIPPSARRHEQDPVTIVLRELTSEQQTAAAKMGGSDRFKLAFESSKMSLYAVRLVKDAPLMPVNHMEGQADVIWNRMSAKCRQLVVLAFNDIHNTSDEEDGFFLSSRRAH